MSMDGVWSNSKSQFYHLRLYKPRHKFNGILYFSYHRPIYSGLSFEFAPTTVAV